MPSHKRKYLTLKDASIISGYTVRELQNFVKIGLVPFRKVKNRVYIRFDAFEKINAGVKDQKAAMGKKKKRTAKSPVKTKNQTSVLSLVPFVPPNRALVKVLEPVAFAAALVMVLHVAALPGVSENIVSGIGFTQGTIDYMAEATTDLIEASWEVPTAIAYSQAALLAPARGTSSAVASDAGGKVAGIATGGVMSATNATGSVSEIEKNMADALIAVADASDAFQRAVLKISDAGYNYIVSNLRFENLDVGIQKTFLW